MRHIYRLSFAFAFTLIFVDCNSREDKNKVLNDIKLRKHTTYRGTNKQNHFFKPVIKDSASIAMTQHIKYNTSVDFFEVSSDSVYRKLFVKYLSPRKISFYVIAKNFKANDTVLYKSGKLIGYIKFDQAGPNMGYDDQAEDGEEMYEAVEYYSKDKSNYFTISIDTLTRKRATLQYWNYLNKKSYPFESRDVLRNLK
ncbi:MAG TPA: hypothetical protein VF598_14490 [Hymenobacter sp.]|jgi:hypothetical protein